MQSIRGASSRYFKEYRLDAPNDDEEYDVQFDDELVCLFFFNCYSLDLLIITTKHSDSVFVFFFMILMRFYIMTQIKMIRFDMFIFYYCLVYHDQTPQFI
ncbi:uncharacterized protein DS421_16g536830 [Arachis hypogaea]|nr:uncharacterized protein DS421_16g536830 [Arachis hypogaea]